MEGGRKNEPGRKFARIFVPCLKYSQMKFNILFTLLLSIELFACKNSNNVRVTETTHKDSTTVAIPKQPFDGIEFASKMDMACGMPLTAGVQDTAHYNGKVYGFCSSECKSDFLKAPETFLSSKYRH
jgi:YHS domain-containing protein